MKKSTKGNFPFIPRLKFMVTRKKLNLFVQNLGRSKFLSHKSYSPLSIIDIVADINRKSSQCLWVTKGNCEDPCDKESVGQ